MLISILILLLIPVSVNAASYDSLPASVNISGGYLNVRSGPSASSPKLSTLQKDSIVTLISQTGSWWKVEYAKGKYGYCHSAYLLPIKGTATNVAVTSGSLNVRSGPGTTNAKIASLFRNEVVIVLSSSNSWSKILFHGTKVGYVSSSYLGNYYHSVSNPVPNLKQMDSRWADLTVGPSQKTFAQIGCATTAIAMLESRRRGYTIYPNHMAEELRYTPSGNVYWPSEYVVVTDFTNYLSRIYALLKQGKAVLFGSRNQYGAQHWIIISGFSGGDSLSPEKFLINDPGSYSRTNLRQFLNVYPSHYKYFYY